ncbi:methyltransferase [Terribacillus saccharophilus]|uniref:Methyltransferase n=1 Tax=Terribacillus saccharophilus TaxID=361277 RepID=A0A075LHN8_9BACI|nr:O-methyltransferase [Terribacillus goriensis]AIF65741.1 methyltransferase [Terribacillus goriensis]
MNVMENKWSDVDTVFLNSLLPAEEDHSYVLEANQEAELPQIDVSPLQGRLLHLLAKIKGAKHILEIGTLGGYSTIWLAKALPASGKLYTLEAHPYFAEVARSNIATAGLEDKAEVVVGNANDTLPELYNEQKNVFDFIFLDADKQSYPEYLKWAIKLAAPGAVIVADNVVREGEVANEQSTDERVLGVQQFLKLLSTEPRIEATAVQTVGSKGYDGFVLGYVK